MSVGATSDEPAHGLDTDRNAKQRRLAVAPIVGPVPLADRQHRRHDHRAGMDRTAFERVVEILAMDRGAVDQSRGGGGQRARVPDRGARPVVVTRSERAFYIIFVARGDGEPDHVDQKLLAFAPHCLRQLGWIERGDLLREMFGNGDFGEKRGGGHGEVIGLYALVIASVAKQSSSLLRDLDCFVASLLAMTKLCGT